MKPVVKPTLAPLPEVLTLLEEPWESGILTHNGPLVRKLEEELKKKLGADYLSVVVNGTMALQLAIKSLGIRGEIIVPAFSWIATLSAIEWEGCSPVFCDVRDDTFNIDTTKIPNLISPKTVAIMPVHVFGQPCEVDKIAKIADEYSLRVIYDAAHAVGSTFNGVSLLNFGDYSATSFHSTKIFNTGEGGAIVSRSNTNNERIRRLRFFGYDDQKNIVDDGTNAKMTEIHAAVGLANLTYMDYSLSERRRINTLYRKSLANVRGIRFQKVRSSDTNFSYFPILMPTELKRDKLLDSLLEEGFQGRKYFYPCLSTIKRYEKKFLCPTSVYLSNHIICLPSYSGLGEQDIVKISEVVKSNV